MKYVLIDTCFWIALFDKRDSDHENAKSLSTLLDNPNYRIATSYPCLYETISTRMVGKDKIGRQKQEGRERIKNIEVHLSNNAVILVDDNLYRNNALYMTYQEAKGNFVIHSLVDNVLREMLKDINLKIDILITANEKDFIDICSQRNIEIINYQD